MIKNLNMTETNTIIAMEYSPFEFYLTGSKYFRGQGNDTDFFCNDSVELHPFLESLGFVKLIDTRYKDESVVTIYRHTEVSVDIQVVKDAKLKQVVQDALLAYGITEPDQICWNLCLEVARKMRASLQS